MLLIYRVSIWRTLYDVKMGYAVDEHFAFYAASFLAMRGNLYFPSLGKTASYLSNFKCVHTLVKRPIMAIRLNKLKSHSLSYVVCQACWN